MRRTVLLLTLILSAATSRAIAQSGDNVLLVVNETSADSARIAEHYARVRGVPQTQVLRIKVDASADELERAVYVAQIENPVSDWIRRNSAQDRILYLVLTKGIPLRVKGTSGRGGTMASVDSELTLLYRKLAGLDPPLPGPLANPYFLGDAPIAQARLFSHQTSDLYLVTRLDGYTVDDALALVDRGATPVREGRILLDQKGGLVQAGGDTWLQATADWMASHGFGDRVVLETTSRVLAGEKNVLGYYSWGSNDPAIIVRNLGFGFVPGALAGMFVSTDARTFKEPPVGWTTGPWTDRTKFFAGSPQSLAGDLIRQGVTGVAGHVAEPYLDATIRPNVLFPAYLTGFNLAESYYLAMPFVSWQTVVVGDPLCAPFPRKPFLPSDIDKGMDPTTELPVLFSAKRLQAVVSNGVKPEAAQRLLRSEARTAKGDKAGTVTALEEATTIDPQLTSAHLLLAQAYDAEKDYDKAIDRYRKVLAVNPNDAAALNNLAYALAERKGQPAEAIGYAERAMKLAPGNATLADTLGWVQHLLGRDREALPLLAGAVKELPGNAEVRLHAAVVYEAVGMLEPAVKELQEALKLDPSLARTEIVKTLQLKIAKRQTARPRGPEPSDRLPRLREGNPDIIGHVTD
jgi:uncharacterized protein (TIGR03790 family)